MRDFGIARAASATTMTQAGSILGTVHYISPEQALGEIATPRSDLYSLGVVLYEMLTGELPYEAETPVGVIMKHVGGLSRSAREVNPLVPEELDALVSRLLAKDPEERPAHAATLVEELERISQSFRGSEADSGDRGADPDHADRPEVFDHPVPKEPSKGHRERESRESNRRKSRPGLKGVVEVDGTPIPHRTLSEQHAERYNTKTEQRPCRTCKGRCALFRGVCAVGEQLPVEHDRGGRAEDSYGGEVQQGLGSCGCHQATEYGTGQASETESGVEGGHNRSSIPFLYRDGLGVHGHVQRAVRSSEHGQSRYEPGQARRERRQDEREREQ